jgi:hypothetical protein
MGNYIFDIGNNITYLKDKGVNSNRAQLIDFCLENELIIINTTFDKPNEKLATIKHQATKPPYKYERTFFDTTDYWLAPQRWKNSCKCQTRKLKSYFWFDQ